MNADDAVYTMAQEGLRQIEEAIIRLLEINPQGLRNAQIADSLGLRSDFRGNQKDYLTYSVLGGLIAKEKVIRDEESKLFTKIPIAGEEIDIAGIGRAMY